MPTLGEAVEITRRGFSRKSIWRSGPIPTFASPQRCRGQMPEPEDRNPMILVALSNSTFDVAPAAGRD